MRVFGFVSFYGLLFGLLFCSSLLAEEATSADGLTSSPASKISAKDTLLKSLDVYEKLLLDMLIDYQAMEGKTTFRINATNPQGDSANFNLSAQTRGDPQKKKMWLNLTGDLGELLVSIDEKRAKILSPHFLMYSFVDLAQFSQSPEVSSLIGSSEDSSQTSSAAKEKSLSPNQEARDTMLLIIEKIRQEIVNTDEARFKNFQKASYLGEDCHALVISPTQGDPAEGSFYFSKATHLLRGIQASADEGLFKMDFHYDADKFPVKLQGNFQDKTSQTAGDFKIDFKYQDKKLRNLNLRINGKGINSIRLLVQLNMETKDLNPNFKETDFEVDIDPQTMREVPVDALFQNIVMGSLQNLMQFQNLMMSQGSAPDVSEGAGKNF